MSAVDDKLPPGLQLHRRPSELVLSYRHHRGTGLFLILAGLFWTACLPLCVRFLAHDGRFGPAEALTLLPFLGMTLGFLYVGFAKVLNRTELALTSDTIGVHHSPLPWFGSRRLHTPAVAALRVSHDEVPQEGCQATTVALIAELRDGKTIPLLQAIPDLRAARRMQQEAAAFLLEGSERSADPER